jgi:flagellar biogenesis protein FliO
MPRPGIVRAEAYEETFCMQDQIDWVRLLLSWVPFFLIIIAWWVVARFFRQRAASGATMVQLYEQQVTETRRTNAALERIAGALEAQIPHEVRSHR